jgi:integrase
MLSKWLDNDAIPERKRRNGRPIFHDLRHSSAALGLAAGENIKVVQERLGHFSATMTVDVYAKAFPTLQREAAIRMDSILLLTGPRQGPRERMVDKKTLQRL